MSLQPPELRSHLVSFVVGVLASLTATLLVRSEFTLVVDFGQTYTTVDILVFIASVLGLGQGVYSSWANDNKIASLIEREGIDGFYHTFYIVALPILIFGTGAIIAVVLGIVTAFYNAGLQTTLSGTLAYILITSTVFVASVWSISFLLSLWIGLLRYRAE